MITAAQLRAARGLLDWTRAELAKASGLSPETIKNIEHGIFKPTEATTQAIANTFITHDVEFMENEGVQKKRNQIKSYYGPEGYVQFLNQVYEELKDTGGKIRQFNIDEDVIGYAGDFSAMHLDRMSKIENLDARVLVPNEIDEAPISYCTYRYLKSKEHRMLAPYYIYGNNVSMASFRDKNHIEVISINSTFLSNIFIEQFDVIWDLSAPIKANTQAKVEMR